MFNQILGNKQKNKMKTEGSSVLSDFETLKSSGLPIRSKDGYFWDNHQHPQSLEIISRFLPVHYEEMCHLDIYEHLKSSGILAYACIDNFVVNFIKKYPSKSILILDMAYAAAYKQIIQNHRKKIYRTVPLIDSDKVPESLTKGNITTVSNSVKNKKFKTDMDIVNNIGFTVYQHIKFHLYQFKDVDMINVTTNLSRDANIEYIFEILYPSVSPHNGTYLFHGSSFCNWYNIVLNGIEAPKDTSDVINGSAHGLAIYTGKNYNMSRDYSSCGGSTINSTRMIMGVVQTRSGAEAFTSTDMATYKKASDVSLRYIIVYSKHPKSENMMNMVQQVFPKKQFNKKESNNLFDLNEYDSDRIVTIGGESEYIELDNGEQIYVGNNINFLEDTKPNIPFIELEDGTHLYDQSYMLDNTESKSIDDIIELNVGHLYSDIPEKSDEPPSSYKKDKNNNYYIELEDGTILYDDYQSFMKRSDNSKDINSKDEITNEYIYTNPDNYYVFNSIINIYNGFCNYLSSPNTIITMM
jgi:hypothetical protein